MKSSLGESVHVQLLAFQSLPNRDAYLGPETHLKVLRRPSAHCTVLTIVHHINGRSVFTAEIDLLSCRTAGQFSCYSIHLYNTVSSRSCKSKACPKVSSP